MMLPFKLRFQKTRVDVVGVASSWRYVMNIKVRFRARDVDINRE